MTTTERRPEQPATAPGSTGPPPGTGPHPTPPLWRGRGLLFVVGIAMIFLGVKGIVHNTHDWENPVYWVKLFVLGALVHDLVVAPAVAVVGFVLLRLVPTPFRAPLQVGLFTAVIVTLVAVPGVFGYGVTPGNPSIHPLDYDRGLLITLLVIAALTAVAEGLVLRRHRRPGPDA